MPRPDFREERNVPVARAEPKPGGDQGNEYVGREMMMTVELAVWLVGGGAVLVERAGRMLMPQKEQNRLKRQFSTLSRNQSRPESVLKPGSSGVLPALSDSGGLGWGREFALLTVPR